MKTLKTYAGGFKWITNKEKDDQADKEYENELMNYKDWDLKIIDED